MNGENYRAFVYYLYGFALGDRDATLSLLHIVKSNLLADQLPSNSGKWPELFFTVQFAAITPNEDKQLGYINGIGDLLYYGVDIHDKKAEQFENSLQIYKLSNSLEENSYAKLAIAYMLEQGEGSVQDLHTAHTLYWDILNDSLNQGHGSLFFPALARIGTLKAKQLFVTVSQISQSLFSFLPKFAS